MIKGLIRTALNIASAGGIVYCVSKMTDGNFEKSVIVMLGIILFAAFDLRDRIGDLSDE